MIFRLILGDIENTVVTTRSKVHSVASGLMTHADVISVCLIIIFTGLLFFFNLGSGPLWWADEQTYSQWGFYMAKTGDYLTPWAYGEPSLWIGKPPLCFWLMAFAYQVFGVSNFSTRLWSPIFGVLSCVVVFYFGKRLYNRVVGLLAVLVLSTFFTFFSFARHAMLDVPFIFFMLTSIFFFVLNEEKKENTHYILLSGLFFGLALLTKQTTALLIPLIVAPYLVLTRKSIKSLFTRKFALFLGIGILIISPWLVYMILQYGARFWYVFLLYNNVMRSISPLEGHAGDSLFYFNYLITRENILWVAILPLAVGFSVFKAFRKRNNQDILFVIWIVVILLVFTIAQTKLFWYILPAFPAFAIVIADFLYNLSKKLKKRENY